MGKIRTRVLGLEEVEKEQKKEQKLRAEEKKLDKKKKIRAQGLKGGERMVAVEVDEAAAAKMEKAEKLIQQTVSGKETGKSQKKAKKTKARIRGKKYQAAKKMVDKKKNYRLEEAIALLKKMRFAKFDESVELHLNLLETGLKGEVGLPHSTGKTTKVKVVTDALLGEIEKGKIDFDILITHPSFMPKLAKFAKILGPKGLMPNPKAGTISTNPDEVVKKFSTGTLRWKSEAKFPLIHQMIGKVSFKDQALIENASALLDSVGKKNIVSAFVKTSMSPSVKIVIEKN